MKPLKDIVQSPKFVFGLVWVLTISLFLFGWSKFALDLRNRAQELKQESALAPLKIEDLQARLKSSKSALVLVHLWATWCPPCERELPIYSELQKTFASKNVEFIVISGDAKTDKDAVLKFLVSKNLLFKTYVIDGDPDAFVKAISPGWSGSLPATFLYKSGVLNQMILGESKADVLTTKIQNALAGL